MSKNKIKNKIPFIILTICFILFLFFIGHYGLVNLYKSGTTSVYIVYLVLIAITILMFIFQKKQKHYYFPLITGFLLWAIVGEISEFLGISNLVEIKTGILLLLITIFMIYLNLKKTLNPYLSISLSFFNLIWLFHFILITEFNFFGKTHIITYFSTIFFIILLIVSIVLISRSKSKYTLVLSIVLLVSSFWTILEYLWAFNLIPKLW